MATAFVGNNNSSLDKMTNMNSIYLGDILDEMGLTDLSHSSKRTVLGEKSGNFANIGIDCSVLPLIKKNQATHKSNKKKKIEERAAKRNLPPQAVNPLTRDAIATSNGKILRKEFSNISDGDRLAKIKGMKLAINSTDEKHIISILDEDEEEYFEDDKYEPYNREYEVEDSYDPNLYRSTFSKQVWNESGFA